MGRRIVGLSVSSVPQLERLEEALLAAGAEPALVADLCAACWCDLALAAIAAGEDATVLLADPIARTDVFWELLAWAAAGQVRPGTATMSRTDASSLTMQLPTGQSKS